MAYNGSPNLQSSTIPSSASSHDGSSYPINSPQGVATGQPTDNTQYIPNDPNVAYAIGPDGNPDLNNPIYVDGTPVVPMADNPPVIMTSGPPPPQTFWTKEVFIAIFGIVIVLIGGILLGVASSTRTSCFKKCDQQLYSSYDSYYYSSGFDYLDCLSKCQDSYNAMKGSGIALMVIGAIVLLGDGAFKYMSLQQMQQQMQQPQMQQM